MTPLSAVYLSLDGDAICPSNAELAARLSVPRRQIPSAVPALVSRISDEASPAAVFAYAERSDELAALLSLDRVPSLSGDRVALLAVTLGFGVDRLLEREKRRGIADAYLLDAVASAMAEAAADAVDRAIRAEYPSVVFGRRFSPGYGSLPLSVNTPLLSLLDADKRLGIRQSESLLLHPTKTITAILGGTHENESHKAPDIGAPLF